jgi:phage shock protein E
MRWLLLVLLASAPACSGGMSETTSVRVANGIRTTRTPELAERLKAGPVRVLDVRTPKEFAAGHIAGAENVPIDQLKARLDGLGLAADQEVYVVCESGARSRAASQTLAGRGLLPVDVEDGMAGWRWKGFPVE